MNEISTNIYKSKLYDKAINNQEELQNLENYLTWKYNELLPRWKAIKSKWLFKVKYHPNRSVAKFKARLVAQGFSQIQVINLTKTFAPTIKRELLQIYLAICLFLNLIIYQVDIVGAYLKSNLSNNKFPIFIKLPPKMHQLCQVKEELLWRLLKSLYNLK